MGRQRHLRGERCFANLKFMTLTFALSEGGGR